MKREPKEKVRPRPKHSSQNIPKESIRGSVGSQQSEAAILEDNPEVTNLFKEKYNELIDNYEFVFPTPHSPNRGQPSKERVLAPVDIPQMRAKGGSNKKSSLNSPSPTRVTRDSMRLPFARQDSSPLPRSIKEAEQEKSVNDIVRTFYEQIQMKQSSFLLNMSVVDQSLKQLLDKEHAKIQKWRDEAKGFNNSKVKFSNSKRTSRRYSSFKKRGRAGHKTRSDTLLGIVNDVQQARRQTIKVQTTTVNYGPLLQTPA